MKSTAETALSTLDDPDNAPENNNNKTQAGRRQHNHQDASEHKADAASEAEGDKGDITPPVTLKELNEHSTVNAKKRKKRRKSVSARRHDEKKKKQIKSDSEQTTPQKRQVDKDAIRAFIAETPLNEISGEAQDTERAVDDKDGIETKSTRLPSGVVMVPGDHTRQNSLASVIRTISDASEMDEESARNSEKEPTSASTNAASEGRSSDQPTNKTSKTSDTTTYHGAIPANDANDTDITEERQHIKLRPSDDSVSHRYKPSYREMLRQSRMSKTGGVPGWLAYREQSTALPSTSEAERMADAQALLTRSRRQEGLGAWLRDKWIYPVIVIGILLLHSLYNATVDTGGFEQPESIAVTESMTVNETAVTTRSIVTESEQTPAENANAPDNSPRSGNAEDAIAIQPIIVTAEPETTLPEAADSTVDSDLSQSIERPAVEPRSIPDGEVDDKVLFSIIGRN